MYSTTAAKLGRLRLQLEEIERVVDRIRHGIDRRDFFPIESDQIRSMHANLQAALDTLREMRV